MVCWYWIQVVISSAIVSSVGTLTGLNFRLWQELQPLIVTAFSDKSSGLFSFQNVAKTFPAEGNFPGDAKARLKVLRKIETLQ